MKSMTQRYQEDLEKKQLERDMRNNMRGILDKLLEDDKFIRIAHRYEDDKARERLIDDVESYLDDWELEYTDENIIEALKHKIWGEE